MNGKENLPDESRKLKTGLKFSSTETSGWRVQTLSTVEDIRKKYGTWVGFVSYRKKCDITLLQTYDRQRWLFHPQPDVLERSVKVLIIKHRGVRVQKEIRLKLNFLFSHTRWSPVVPCRKGSLRQCQFTMKVTKDLNRYTHSE